MLFCSSFLVNHDPAHSNLAGRGRQTLQIEIEQVRPEPGFPKTARSGHRERIINVKRLPSQHGISKCITDLAPLESPHLAPPFSAASITS